MRRFLAFCCALLVYTAPLSAAPLRPDLRALDSLPLHAAPAQLVQHKQLAAAVKDRPFQFAVGAPLPLTVADGRWDRLDAQTWRWRTRVYSAGAESINLEFSRFQLPPGAALWLYDADGALVQGPYTSADQTPEGRLWTALVLGETAVIEARVPADRRPDFALELAQLNHGFRFFGKDGGSAKSGQCNVDVRCPLGDAWRDPIRSVARITIGGTAACTGQLVNNVRQNDAPLFLTADHCGIGDPGAPASSVVFYWNYQTSTCNGTRDGSLAQNQSGATFLADDPESDFTLLRLNSAPSSAFNVFLSGWNAGGDTPQCGTSIHHPGGDEKRISAYVGASRAQAQVRIGGPTIEAWRVIWQQGTTEQGSSGGGLWNQRREIVGVLSGGEAACASPTADNDLPDYYGRLEVAWTADANPAGQLKAHLDPDNTGTRSLCGKNPGAGLCSALPPVSCAGGGTPPPDDSDGGGGALGLGLLVALLLGAARRHR